MQTDLCCWCWVIKAFMTLSASAPPTPHPHPSSPPPPTTHTPKSPEPTGTNAGKMHGESTEMPKELQAFEPVSNLWLSQLRHHTSWTRDKYPLCALFWPIESMSLRNSHFIPFTKFWGNLLQSYSTCNIPSLDYKSTKHTLAFYSPYSSGQIFSIKDQRVNILGFAPILPFLYKNSH